MWNLPGPGIEPVSPELAGGFLPAASPAKSDIKFLNGKKGSISDAILEIIAVKFCWIVDVVTVHEWFVYCNG